MSIFEFDEEKHIKSEQKEWREIRRKEGSDNLAKLFQSLMDSGKIEEINRVIFDSAYRKSYSKNKTKRPAYAFPTPAAFYFPVLICFITAVSLSGDPGAPRFCCGYQ